MVHAKFIRVHNARGFGKPRGFTKQELFIATWVSQPKSKLNIKKQVNRVNFKGYFYCVEIYL